MSDAGSPQRPTPARKRQLLLRVGVLVVLGGALGVFAWRMLKPGPNEAVQELNNRGVGLMERFDYQGAIPVFEEVVRKAPDWLPGRINLGIALLNGGKDDPAELKRCRATFEAVLHKEPDNPYAHFCLGILLMYEKDQQDAVKHFEAVLKTDPNDAYTWYWLGTLKSADAEEQLRYYRKALELDPHLSAAIYGESMLLRRTDLPKSLERLTEVQHLKRANWENVVELKFSRMGHYAEVIGRPAAAETKPRIGPLPVLQRCDAAAMNLPPVASWASVQLTPSDARWASQADDAHEGDELLTKLWRQVRARFGATMVVLDYNNDGKPDLFLVRAVWVRDAKSNKERLRDLLLRNDGGGRFTDVTIEAGLGASRPALGCCVGDFDNDGHADLLLTGAGKQYLFRNTGRGTFEDVTSEASKDVAKGIGLADSKAVCLTASAVDLDQDSDLDLIFSWYGGTGEEALRRLKGEEAGKSGGAVVYLHKGEAPPVKEGKTEPPLKLQFEETTLPSLEARWKEGDVSPLRGAAGPGVGVAATDMDGDRDLDLLVLQDGSPPIVVLNDRLLKFRRRVLSEQRFGSGNWNGALVFDIDHDGRSDLLLLPVGQSPRLLHNRFIAGEKDVDNWFEPLTLDAPPLRQAVAVDLDMDTWTDIVGISQEGQLVFLHNKGGRLVRETSGFGQAPSWSQDLLAVSVCDIDGDGCPDVVVWSEQHGLQLYANRGNGNQAVQVRLRGHNMDQGQNRVRCNADAVGVWATAQVRNQWAGQEYTTLSAGLGQSRSPLLLGLGPNRHADALRLRWPDGTWQAELNLLAGAPLRLSQYNRLPGSCPILFAWNGRRFVFVNDFLGAGSVGETGPDGACRPPRSEESIKIEPEQLLTRDGQYVLKITEPMNEITYLDYLQLLVIDQPPGIRVYPDERFVTAGPPPSQELIAFQKEIHPIKAHDHRGLDVTATLRKWDRVSVEDFAKRAWMGFAEEHSIELDFGDRLASFTADDRLYLCLAGWTAYPFPESSWAAHQAGVAEQWPILERQDESGQWRSLGEAGFPAGMPRMMLRDVTGKLTGGCCRLRLRTNMQIYWDQVFIAAECRTVAPCPPAAQARESSGLRCGLAKRTPRAIRLDVHKATLEPGRLVKEHSPDGREPALYDYDRHEAMPLVRQAGRMTRLGDVTELLHGRDDRFVIFGPGDDLTVRFDAASLPSLPSGWQRSFVLRTAGYCKDTALSTAHGTTVEPLPFQAMRNYPYGPDQHYPRDPLHIDYLRRFLTREVEADPSPVRGRRWRP
ncbi:MAG TPA: FG-GAP-like repeat-containing protein [Gemmataceae bacterium]|nr:FG-GAP-like repeat-containing protein [Gemmataceae bacterium]